MRSIYGHSPFDGTLIKVCTYKQSHEKNLEVAALFRVGLQCKRPKYLLVWCSTCCDVDNVRQQFAQLLASMLYFGLQTVLRGGRHQCSTLAYKRFWSAGPAISKRYWSGSKVIGPRHSVRSQTAAEQHIGQKQVNSCIIML